MELWKEIDAKVIVECRSGMAVCETRLNVLAWPSILILPIELFFSLQYYIFTELYIRIIVGSPSEGWNKIMSKYYI